VPDVPHPQHVSDAPRVASREAPPVACATVARGSCIVLIAMVRKALYGESRLNLAKTQKSAAPNASTTSGGPTAHGMAVAVILQADHRRRFLSEIPNPIGTRPVMAALRSGGGSGW
jgi:hypothetical protein